MRHINRGLVLWLLLLGGSALAQTKKYDMRSGVVTYDVVMSMGGMQVKTKVVVSFDDFGMKERRDTYKDGAVNDSFLSDGKDRYKVIPSEKTAYKAGPAFRGTELKVDWNEVSAQDKKQGKAKKLPPRTVVGKSCETYQVKTPDGTMAVGGFRGVLLYSEVSGMGTKTTTTAVKLEENAKVSPDVFQVPAGYKVQ